MQSVQHLCFDPRVGPERTQVCETMSMNISGKKAVIIGGGPAGLCAALVLHKHGWNDITIVEKRQINSFESDKAYQYLIDERGQTLTQLLNITGPIALRSVSTKNTRNFCELLPSGKMNVKHMPWRGDCEKY